MIDLFDKHKPMVERRDAMIAAGVEPFGLTIEEFVTPTLGIIQGRQTILAGTNNYMGVTFEKQCIEAGKKALDDYGTGTTGSRVANGTYKLHKQLEAEIARFMDKKHCIVFSTGYTANVAMMAGLAGPRDTIYLDSDSHASIYDGCAVSGARLVRFRHNNAADLAKRLERNKDSSGGQLVVLEGMYSMLGDRAPIADFIELKKKYGFQLLLDEAHSFGVLGPNGRGAAEEAGCYDEADFIVGTFSKSCGAIGGFGVGNHPMFEAIRLASRPYVFTASPSPASVATTLEAVRLLAREPERRDRLRENADRLFNGFKGLGLELGCDVSSPVIAVKCPDEEAAVGIWKGLLESGVYVNIALPPGTPGNECLLRCSVSCAHSFEEIDKIIELFGDVFGQFQGASQPGRE